MLSEPPACHTHRALPLSPAHRSDTISTTGPGLLVPTPIIFLSDKTIDLLLQGWR